MDPTTTTNKIETTTFSKPCDYCGCPYPGDHALDCPAPSVKWKEFDQLEKRCEALEQHFIKMMELMEKLSNANQQTINLLLTLTKAVSSEANKPPQPS